MARRKRVVVTCPICGTGTSYWVAESTDELADGLFCKYCGEEFNREGKVVLK